MWARIVAKSLAVLLFVPLLSSCGQKDEIGTGPSSIPSIGGPPPGAQVPPPPGAPGQAPKTQPAGAAPIAPPPGAH